MQWLIRSGKFVNKVNDCSTPESACRMEKGAVDDSETVNNCCGAQQTIWRKKNRESNSHSMDRNEESAPLS